MDDIFLIVINVISAAILISYVIYNSIRKKRIKKAAEAAEVESVQSDERPTC